MPARGTIVVILRADIPGVVPRVTPVSIGGIFVVGFGPVAFEVLVKLFVVKVVPRSRTSGGGGDVVLRLPIRILGLDKMDPFLPLLAGFARFARSRTRDRAKKVVVLGIGQWIRFQGGLLLIGCLASPRRAPRPLDHIFKHVVEGLVIGVAILYASSLVLGILQERLHLVQVEILVLPRSAPPCIRSVLISDIRKLVVLFAFVVLALVLPPLLAIMLAIILAIIVFSFPSFKKFIQSLFHVLRDDRLQFRGTLQHALHLPHRRPR